MVNRSGARCTAPTPLLGLSGCAKHAGPVPTPGQVSRTLSSSPDPALLSPALSPSEAMAAWWLMGPHPESGEGRGLHKSLQCLELFWGRAVLEGPSKDGVLWGDVILDPAREGKGVFSLIIGGRRLQLREAAAPLWKQASGVPQFPFPAVCLRGPTLAMLSTAGCCCWRAVGMREPQGCCVACPGSPAGLWACSTAAAGAPAWAVVLVCFLLQHQAPSPSRAPSKVSLGQKEAAFFHCLQHIYC